MEVYKAINKIQATLAKSGISKSRTASMNGKAMYAFRGIDDVYNTLAPLLAEHKLCIIPRMISREVTERETGRGNALFYVTLEAEFDFVSAEDGSKHTARTFGEAMDSGDKATNKAMSIAYKYACFQTFAIPTEEDNDPDATIHESIKPERKTEQKVTVSHVIEAIRACESMEDLQSIIPACSEFQKGTDEYLQIRNEYSKKQDQIKATMN